MKAIVLCIALAVTVTFDNLQNSSGFDFVISTGLVSNRPQHNRRFVASTEWTIDQPWVRWAATSNQQKHHLVIHWNRDVSACGQFYGHLRGSSISCWVSGNLFVQSSQFTFRFFTSDTTEIFDEFPSNPCTNNMRARWDLQVHRFGQRLSECLLNSVAEVNSWNDYVNTVHHTAQATTNQVQNTGKRILPSFASTTIINSRNCRLEWTRWIHIEKQSWTANQRRFEGSSESCSSLSWEIRSIPCIGCRQRGIYYRRFDSGLTLYLFIIW